MQHKTRGTDSPAKNKPLTPADQQPKNDPTAMKSYNSNFRIKETGKPQYQVLYNNEDCILYTDNLDKAIKMAKECAKCAETECSYQIYCCTDSVDIMIKEYEVIEK